MACLCSLSEEICTWNFFEWASIYHERGMGKASPSPHEQPNREILYVLRPAFVAQVRVAVF
eukprot:c30391_g1_i1 orf=83-265(-)